MPRPLAIALGVFALLILGGIAFSIHAQRQHRAAVNAADRTARQLIALQGSLVSLTPANLARAEANRNALAAQLAALQAELQSGAGAAIPDQSPYSSPQDLFFDIVAMLEGLRGEAARLGIRLADGDDENFGFDDVIRRGTAPDDDSRHDVYRDRMATDFLVRALFAAQPQSLLAVQREVPEMPPATGRQLRGAAGLGDSFSVDPSVTAAVPGAIDTRGVRLVFTGRTASLRQFLATLAAFERPLVVRSVEVAPVRQDRTRRADSPAAPARTGSPFDTFGFGGTVTPATSTAAPVPIVQDNLSRFSVTVELFRLVPEAAATEVAP